MLVRAKKEADSAMSETSRETLLRQGDRGWPLVGEDIRGETWRMRSSWQCEEQGTAFPVEQTASTKAVGQENSGVCPLGGFLPHLLTQWCFL